MARLADRGEQVVGRITDLPGAKTLVDSMASLTKQLNETQRRLRSLDPLEKRVTALEKRFEKLEGKGSSAKRTTTRKTSTAAKAAPKRTTTPPQVFRLVLGRFLLGNSQAERARDDLEGRRRRARLLAVELNRQRDRRVDRHVAPA